MVREAAAATPGRRADARPDAPSGCCARATPSRRRGPRPRRRGDASCARKLVVGADGRDSQIAELAGVKAKTCRTGASPTAATSRAPPPDSAPDGTIWMLDPQWAAAFPTDSGLIFYAAMPTKDRLPEFKRDPETALVSFARRLPGGAADPRRRAWSSRCSARSRCRTGCGSPVAPGLALVGDAALAVDPLFGVGCGWAFQSGEWLADSVAPALHGSEPLERGLKRYRRRHRNGPARPRLHDQRLRDRADDQPRRKDCSSPPPPATRRSPSRFDEFGTRRIGPAQMLRDDDAAGDRGQRRPRPREASRGAREAEGRRGLDRSRGPCSRRSCGASARTGAPSSSARPAAWRRRCRRRRAAP